MYLLGAGCIAAALYLLHIAPPIAPGATSYKDFGHMDRFISMAAAVLGVWYIVLAALRTYTTTYTITTQRLRVRSGIMSTTDEEVELRRVQDLTIVCPLAYRLSGRGNIIVEAADVSSSEDGIMAIKDPERVHDLLRATIEQARSESGVREVSMIGGPHGGNSGGRFISGAV